MPQRPSRCCLTCSWTPRGTSRRCRCSRLDAMWCIVLVPPVVVGRLVVHRTAGSRMACHSGAAASVHNGAMHHAACEQWHLCDEPCCMCALCGHLVEETYDWFRPIFLLLLLSTLPFQLVDSTGFYWSVKNTVCIVQLLYKFDKTLWIFKATLVLYSSFNVCYIESRSLAREINDWIRDSNQSFSWLWCFSNFKKRFPIA